MKRLYLSGLIAMMMVGHVVGQQIIYVDDSAQGANDGTSWANAYVDLQSALGQAQSGDQIWVAAGTYRPSADADRTKYFELKDGVKLYGGFAGTESSLSERDWRTNVTELSGDIGVVGDSTDNSYTILFMMDVDTGTVVDGFYFRYGQADGGTVDTPLGAGAAIYINGSDGGYAYPRIHNCVFEYNTAYSGGAVMVEGSSDGSVAPQFYNCTFNENKATFNHGGAIFRAGGSWQETPRDFWNCRFYRNRARLDGGAVFYSDTKRTDTLEFWGCEFVENVAERHGGALTIYHKREQYAYLTIDSCKFIANSAWGWSAIYIQPPYQGGFKFEYARINGNLFQGNFPLPQGLNRCFFRFSNDQKSYITPIPDSRFFVSNNMYEHNIGYLSSSMPTNCTLNVKNETYKFNETYFYTFYVTSIYNPGIINIENIRLLNNIPHIKSIINAFFHFRMGSHSKINVANVYMNNNGMAPFIVLYYQNGNPLNPNRGVNLISSTILNTSQTGSDTLTNNRLKVTNSILAGNTPSTYANATISSSLIDVSSYDSLPATTTCGPNNLFGLDPMFLDTAAGDYRLHPCSPARDAGDNSIIDSLGILTDIAGQPRIQGGTVDMGAWESEAFSIRTDSVQAAPCAGAPGSLWLDLTTGCPPFFIALGTDTTISDTSRFQLPLPAGTHTLVITDGRMDADTLQITIPGAPPLLAQLTATDVACPGIAGSATLSPLGGTAPYTYLWSNGDTAATATGLPAGLHTVTLTDANGCTLTDSVEIGTSGHLTLGISIQPISCHDSADGVAAITPQDGNWPYSWLWNDGNTDSLRTDIAGGNYSVTVTDALGCTDELSFFLPAPDSLQATASATPPACAGQATGSATATATGGTAPYSYLWSNSSSFQTITNLAPGYYSVTVTDVKGCQDTTGVLVQAPPALSLSIAGATVVCPGDSTLLAAQVSGGTPPYTYQWNTPGIPPADSSITVGPGSYSLTVVDANGCSKTTSHIVSEDPPIQLLFEVLPVTNPNQPNGAVEVQLTFGGTPPYSYQWSHGPTTASVDSLPPGQYTLTVTDAAGCSETFFFEVLLTSTKNPAAAALQALIVPNPSGSGGAVLQLQGPWPQHLLLSLHDTHGRLLWQRSVLRSEEINLPGKNTPAGNYWLLLRSEQGAVLKGLKWVVVE